METAQSAAGAGDAGLNLGQSMLCRPALSRRGLLAAMGSSTLLAGAATPLFARASAYPATQALIDGYVANGRVPGAVVGIVKPGAFRPTWLTTGRTAFEGGEPVTPQTIWRVYSMTKPITGIAVLQQVEAGRLTLDTPIADIMPEFRQMRVLTDPDKSLETRPAVKPILVRHLLTHTAGFTYTIMGNGPLEKEYVRLGLQPMSSATFATPGDPPAPDLATYMARLATVPLRTEPGEAIRYSIALDVAGAMLERLTGTTLDRIFARQLFDPLGMADTGFWVTPAQQKRLAGLYAWVDATTRKPADKPLLVDSAAKSEWAARPTMLAGGAGLVSSAENYARFAQMMLNDGMFQGRRLLTRETARLATSNQLRPGLFMAPGEGLASGGRATVADRSAADGFNPGVWGWGGAARTLFHIDPVRGEGVVLMMQSLSDEAGPKDEDLKKALNADARS